MPSQSGAILSLDPESGTKSARPLRRRTTWLARRTRGSAMLNRLAYHHPRAGHRPRHGVLNTDRSARLQFHIIQERERSALPLPIGEELAKPCWPRVLGADLTRQLGDERHAGIERLLEQLAHLDDHVGLCAVLAPFRLSRLHLPGLPGVDEPTAAGAFHVELDGEARRGIRARGLARAGEGSRSSGARASEGNPRRFVRALPSSGRPPRGARDIQSVRPASASRDRWAAGSARTGCNQSIRPA